MRKMKKVFWVLLPAVLVAFYALAAPSAATAAPNRFNNPLADDYQEEIYTAVVTLRDIEVDRYSLIFKVSLPNGGESEIRASKSCPFLDERGKLISHSEFLERYRDKTVTIDFRELDPKVYIAIEARAGNS